MKESDPQWVSDWLAQKVLAGVTRFGGWDEMVTRLPAEERERLLKRFSNELLDPNEQGRVLSLLATSADEELAAPVFERACEIRRGLSTVPGADMPKWNLLRQLKDLLDAIAPTILLGGLSDKLEKEPEATELDVLTDVLAKFNPPDTEIQTAVPDDLKQKFHGYLKRAVERAADPKGVGARVRAYLAVLLGQVGGPDDIPDLRRLIKADSIRFREMQAARMKGEPLRRQRELRVCLRRRGNDCRFSAWGRSSTGNAGRTTVRTRRGGNARSESQEKPGSTSARS